MIDIMAIQGQKDPNRGPFKLEYDVTPQDLTAYNPAFDQYTKTKEDFRYQGFPSKKFEKARNPFVASESEAPDNIAQVYYPSKRWLNPNKPLSTGSAKGFRYGSEEVSEEDKSNAKVVKDAFKEHTSAELLKYRKIQEQVDADLQQMKEHKVQMARKKQRDQEQNFKQLNSYDPWGKPGGGAPPLITGAVADGDFYSGFGKAGNGAPLRTESGKVKTNIKGDTLIRFQSTESGKQTVAQGHIRWNRDAADKNSLAKDLLAQQEEVKQRAFDERRFELQKEMEMIKQAQHHPYGKPGAGAPNPRSSDADYNHRGYQPPGTPEHFKWGTGVGNANRDQHGDVLGFRRATKDSVHTELDSMSPRDKSLNLDASRGGAGAPIRAENGAVTTRMPITMKRDDKGDSMIRENMPSSRHNKDFDSELHQVYDPWGKGGGGAPNKDSAGNVRSTVYGKLYSERHIDEMKTADYKREQLNEQRRMIDSQNMHKKMQDTELKYGNGEFASVIRSKAQRQTNGNYHLPSSDVTKQAVGNNWQFMPSHGMDDSMSKMPKQQMYHTELQRLASQRQMERHTEKLRDRQESSQHLETNSQTWGKPGAGAPLREGTRKKNLDAIINSPRDMPVDFYSKNVQPGKQPYNYVRNTTQSTSNNHYDFEPELNWAQAHSKVLPLV